MIQYSKWMDLPLYIKSKLAEQFKLERIRPIHVANNTVIDDGFNLKDVEQVFTIESLQMFLETKEKEVDVLLEILKNWADGTYTIPVEEKLAEVKETTNDKKTK